MDKVKNIIWNNRKEIAYQSVIITVLYIFFSYDQDHSHGLLNSIFGQYKLAFFANYVTATMLINYLVLPKLYYQNKKIWFFIAVSIIVVFVILIDENVLEQIYFPDTRGAYFPGVLFTLIETLPIMIIMVAFKIGWDFNQKQSEIEGLKILVKESELQFLQNQINPHFLFNNLNNLYAHALEQSPKTPTIILGLSSVLRYMLYDCKEDTVQLSKEIKHLKNYTDLHELQISERGSVKFQQNLDMLDLCISPLVLVVFIENAFKHSSESLSNDIFIDIKIDVTSEGVLSFCCTNSFVPDSKSSMHSGIGLENVRKRLDLLYPNSHKLDIIENDNVYKVELIMKLKHTDIC